MKALSIDIETYSSIDLGKCGVYKYASAPDFEILLFGYAVDGGKVQVVDLTAGEALPVDVMTALTDDGVLKWAFNAQFERVCLSRWLGQRLSPISWRCTMVWAATLGLPLSLEGVGTVLGLEKQKLTEGKDLIRYFCVPCKPTKTNGGRTRNKPTDHEEKWRMFMQYNARDVETEMSIQQRLLKFPVPEAIWQQYQLDQDINDRGILVDTALVTHAIECDSLFKEETTRQAYALSGLENPNSVVQVKGWLSEHGLTVDTLGKKAVQELVKETDGEVLEMLKLRILLSKTSVKKYEAIARSTCDDGRVHGLLQFYGANRTGRWAGRLVQVQNLPQNHLTDLALARSLVKAGRYEDLFLLYASVPEVLSELIRTAFIPKEGSRFIVSDFSAIEARVLAWLAGEQWRIDVFNAEGDIYCATAAKMFHVPVVKHGENGELRQKGKQAELACIAEGQLVLTDKGLIPIERITKQHLLWDGDSWVRHDGLVYKGVKEVMTYEGLTATADHLVWIEGKSQPVQFGYAAASGAHLLQTGNGGNPIWLGNDYIIRETMVQKLEPLLCTNEMYWVWKYPMANLGQSQKWKVKRMPSVFTDEKNSTMVGQTADCGKTALSESDGSAVCELWWQRDKIRISERNRGRIISDTDVWTAFTEVRTRSNRQQRELYRRKYPVRDTCGKQQEQTQYCFNKVFTAVLALQSDSGNSKTIIGKIQGRHYTRCHSSSTQKTKKLAANQCTTRVYDIRNAGRHHRFTVSGRLVHNCGYGGAVGALKAMGALELGMKEEELQSLVTAWRSANPHITQYWWAIDEAAIRAVTDRTEQRVGNVRFRCHSGMLFVTLPSGRTLSYVKPRLEMNRFGRMGLTYEGIGENKKWLRIETYGPKLVENIVQGTARDLLAEGMLRLSQRGFDIVMHVHDEVVIEGGTNVAEICSIMAESVPWSAGLPLKADGYECSFYQKD